MGDKITFDYFYGGQEETFSYYRIPRVLFTGQQFKGLSIGAKMLYGLLLDRMYLSSRNGWYDDQGRVYIYYPVEEIEETMGCGHNKAVRLLAELDVVKGIGLIERIWYQMTGWIISPCSALSSRTPKFQCLPLADGHMPEWCEGDALTWPGGSWTPSIGQGPGWPGGSGSSSWRILEGGVLERYCLSPGQCSYTAESTAVRP